MIEPLNLAIARTRELVNATMANPIESVTILQLPAGNTVALHAGQGEPNRPVTQQGQTWEFDPPWRDGLFLTNLAGAGILVLQVDFRTYQAPVPVVLVNRAPPSTPAGRFVDQLLKNFGLR